MNSNEFQFIYVFYNFIEFLVLELSVLMFILNPKIQLNFCIDSLIYLKIKHKPKHEHKHEHKRPNGQDGRYFNFVSEIKVQEEII